MRTRLIWARKIRGAFRSHAKRPLEGAKRPFATKRTLELVAWCRLFKFETVRNSLKFTGADFALFRGHIGKRLGELK
jgi:hypothetical protein